jgi:hypothetical protein
MRDRERRGEKCWGDAYQLHADNSQSGKGRSKADYVANDVLSPIWAAREHLPLPVLWSKRHKNFSGTVAATRVDTHFQENDGQMAR